MRPFYRWSKSLSRSRNPPGADARRPAGTSDAKVAAALVGPSAGLDFWAHAAVPAARAEAAVDAVVNETFSRAVGTHALRTMNSILLTRVKTAALVFVGAVILLTGIAKAESARLRYNEPTGRVAPRLAKSDDERRQGYVKAFRELHEHLGAVYPNFKLKGIDWAGVGRELSPQVAKAETDREFGLLVERLVARLEDSHAWVEKGSETPPQPDLPEWGPVLACLTDDRGRPVIYHVGRRTDAWKAGIRPGMTVVSVNGVEAEQAIKAWMEERRTYIGYSSERYLRYDAVRFFVRQPKQNAAVRLELENVNGGRKHADLKADWRVWYIPRLPVPREGIDDGGGDVEWVKLKDGIGYIHVRRMKQGLEVKLDQALVSLGDLKGLIIDVRGNSGGGFDQGTAFRNFDLGKGKTATAHRPHHAGPIALLIDERCISAGEGWASWFVANKRARLFGTATAGASARKVMYTLSNGMYKVQIPVKAYNGFLTRPIERRGLEPDVVVRMNARDLANGVDTVAMAATRWLLGESSDASPSAVTPGGRREN